MKAILSRRYVDLKYLAYMINVPGIGVELYCEKAIKALMGKGFRHLRQGKSIEIEITAKVVKKGKK